MADKIENATETSAHMDIMSEMLAYERQYWDGGTLYLAGIDEAGRGCCAGPVTAAAVVFTDKSKIPAGLNDSKQLTHEQRMELRKRLLAEKSVLWGIGMVDAAEIDAINILQATWKAMRLAVSKIPSAQFILVDGNPVKGFPLPSQNIVKGDAKSASIAAASILAKTSRDLLMLEMAEKYPQYGFEIHKGYCTELHIQKIREFGACPIHRKTFKPVADILNPPSLVQDSLF